MTAFPRWLPTLAFADALAFATMFVSLVLFKRLGKSNDETTIYTSLLFTPWLLRPMIDFYLPKTLRLPLSLVATEMAAAVLLAVLGVLMRDNASVVCITSFMWLVSLCGVVHSVAAERLRRDALEGHRRTVFAMRLAGFFVAMALCQGLVVALAGNMEVMTRAIRSSWSLAFYLLASVFFVLSLVHSFTLRRCGCAAHRSVEAFMGIDRRTMAQVALLLLSIVPEALTTQVGQLFLIDAPHNGGLGLSPSEYGLVQGTVGMVALVFGGGMGLAVTHKGLLNRWLVPLAVAVTLPVGAYLYLSFSMTGNLVVVGLCAVVKLSSLGFGLSVLYRMLVARVSSKTLSTALIALPLVVVGIFSGAFQESMGYRTFFAVVLSLSPLAWAAIAFANGMGAKLP